MNILIKISNLRKKSDFFARVRVDPWEELFTHKPPAFQKYHITKYNQILQHPPVTKIKRKMAPNWPQLASETENDPQFAF